MYTAKNHSEGPDKLVIGGTLEIEEGASVTGMTTATLVNDLTTGGADKALTAEQGKTLKTQVDAKVATADIVNDLTTGGTSVPLSAEQGKTLSERVAANVPQSVEASAPTVAEFNALLTALKTAGLMVADA